MATLFYEIYEQAKRIRSADVPEPKHPVQQGEKFIGILADDLKPLWAVFQSSKKKLEKFLNGVRGLEDPENISREKYRAILTEHILKENEYELVSTCFWNSVRHEFPEYARNRFGIRKEWKVVIIPDSPPEPEVVVITGSLFSQSSTPSGGSSQLN